MDFEGRVEWAFAGAVLDKLERAEEAAAANAADEGVVGEPFGEQALQQLSAHSDVGQQIVAADDVLHRERGGAAIGRPM